MRRERARAGELLRVKGCLHCLYFFKSRKIKHPCAVKGKGERRQDIKKEEADGGKRREVRKQ